MAKVLGVLVVELVAWALAKASINMAKADLWKARERPSHDKLHFL